MDFRFFIFPRAERAPQFLPKLIAIFDRAILSLNTRNGISSINSNFVALKPLKMSVHRVDSSDLYFLKKISKFIKIQRCVRKICFIRKSIALC